MKNNNVLIISPHADDSELGCGMEVSKLVESGKRVHCLILSTGDSPEMGTKRYEQARRAATILKIHELKTSNVDDCRFFEERDMIFEIIEKYISTVSPESVYLPAGNNFECDEDRDHVITSIEGLRAARFVPNVLFYETLKSYHFQGNFFSLHSKKNLVKKISALKSYVGEVQKGTLDSEEVMVRAKYNAILFN